MSRRDVLDDLADDFLLEQLGGSRGRGGHSDPAGGELNDEKRKRPPAKRLLCPPRETISIDVGRDLSSSTWKTYRFQHRGGVFVAIGPFQGAELTYESSGANALPIQESARFANVGDPEDLAAENDDWGSFFIRKVTGGSNKLVLALFASEDEAAAYAAALGGHGNPGKPGDGGDPSGFNVPSVIAGNAASAQFTGAADTVRLEIKADNGNTGIFYLTDVVGDDVAAKRWSLEQGDVGPVIYGDPANASPPSVYIHTSGNAADNIRIWEHKA